LSEQAKIASLQEKIKEERNNARNMGIVKYFMFAAAIFGFFFYLGGIGGWATLFLGTVCVIGFLVFAIGEWGAIRTKKELMRELDSMGVKVPTCPKCGRELRQEGLSFCPFCGSPLSPPP
jgi:hypothetical protein